MLVKKNDEKGRSSAPELGVLRLQSPMSADYLTTLQEWGGLPEVVTIPDAVQLLATLCRQNHAAILKVIETAILSNEIRYWGLSHTGHWTAGMIRVFHKMSGKPKVRPETTTQPTKIGFMLERDGRLHVEAMGINPGDTVDLLRKRGRKIPDALQALYPSPKTDAKVVPATKSTPAVEPKSGDKPWMTKNPDDPPPDQSWYTPARYFAREFVRADATLLLKRGVLVQKVSDALFSVGIKKRGGVKKHEPSTVKKALSNVSLG